MNRIREFKGKYQVLFTPNLTYSPSQMEMIVGNWDDATLRGFHVREFDTLNEAQFHAFNMPDVDWYRLVRMYVDQYHLNSNIIKKSLTNNNFIAEFKPHLMSPEEVKQSMFDRVLNHGERFTLRYEMNDIMCYDIVNPWSSTLVQIARSIQSIPQLKIKQKWTKGKVIHLLGKTDLGLMYEIRLWPTAIYQWAEWGYKYQNNHNFAEMSHHMYKKAVKAQELVDNGYNCNYHMR